MNAEPVTYADLTDEQRRDVFAYREKQEAHRRMLVPVAWILAIVVFGTAVHTTDPSHRDQLFALMYIVGGIYLGASGKKD